MHIVILSCCSSSHWLSSPDPAAVDHNVMHLVLGAEENHRQNLYQLQSKESSEMLGLQRSVPCGTKNWSLLPGWHSQGSAHTHQLHSANSAANRAAFA